MVPKALDMPILYPANPNPINPSPNSNPNPKPNLFPNPNPNPNPSQVVPKALDKPMRVLCDDLERTLTPTPTLRRGSPTSARCAPRSRTRAVGSS